MGELWKIHLLGGLRVVRAATSAAESSAGGGVSTPTVIERFRTQKTGALLAYLAYYPQSHSREVLCDLLWPESAPSAGAQNLRTSLSSLRRQLEPPGVSPGSVMVCTRSSIQLNSQAVSTDTREFKFACAQTSAAESKERIAWLKRAAALYTGAFLPGFYDDWAMAAARELESEYFAVLLELLELLEANGDLSRALQFARRGAAHDATHPDLLETITRLCRALGVQDDELPSEKSSASRRPKKAQETVAASIPLSTPVAPDEPLPHFAPVVLPAILDRFFGRESEIERVCRELENKQTRLLTLTGTGGSGKTRLAIEAAHCFVEKCHDPEQGVFYVPLADLRDGQLVVGAILEALASAGAPHFTGRAWPEAAPIDRLCAALSQRPTLLVLDNFEHLASTGAPFLQILLSRVPRLQLLVTSQQRLAIPGGREIAIAGLPYPLAEKDQPPLTPEGMLAFPAVQLFVERAQAVAPDFQLTRHNSEAVAEICRRLEGTPLSLELAAARAGVFSPVQIASRLACVQEKFAVLTSVKRPATPRHFSLYTAVTWSYELLPPALARFWTQLSVFCGGFTLEAAQKICDEPSAAHYLGQLRGGSLLNISERNGVLRFRLPELLREYAAEKLQADATGVLQARYARYYEEILGTYADALRTEREAESLTQAVAETENSRSALKWALGNPSPENAALAASLALSLGTCLQRGGLHREAREIVAEGLDAARSLGETHDALRIALLREHAGLSLDLMEWGLAYTKASVMLELCEQNQNLPGIAAATNLLGLAAKGQGDWKTARESFQFAREQFEKDGDDIGLANARNNLGLIEYLDDDGDKTAAAMHLHAALRLRRAMKDRRSIAEARINLGALAQQSGELAKARRHYLAALVVETQLQHLFGVGRALCNLGEISEEQGDAMRAVRLYMAARVLFEEAGIAHLKYTAQRLNRLAGEVELSLDEMRAQARRLAREGALEELARWATQSAV